MRYLIIQRAPKEKCPKGINEYRLREIPPELWKEDERIWLPDNVTPDIYVDPSDDCVERLSKEFPRHFWRWIIESDGTETESEEDDLTAAEGENTLRAEERELPF